MAQQFCAGFKCTYQGDCRQQHKEEIITVAQFKEKNLKPLKSLQTRRKKTKQNKKAK